jgi:HSP20 family protein
MTERSERAVGHWREPFSELELFERLGPLGRGLNRNLLGEFFGQPTTRGRTFAPAVDVAETSDAFVVTAELPGAKPEDVTVEIHDGVLTLRGEKKSERKEEGEHARYVERSFGAFSRSFRLPENADDGKVDAGYAEGVLTLTVAKRAEVKPRTVEIQVK